MTLYNIPAYYPFLDTLAHGLLTQYAGNTDALADIKILLPTRRACRNLTNAFLRMSKGQALILPQMSPIGDLDAEEIDIMFSGMSQDKNAALDIPKALSPLKRNLLLAAQIRKVPQFNGSMTQSVKLAIALGQLMDQIYNENLDLKDLHKLVPEDFATHWQVTIKFLEIISLTWPDILKSHNAIDAADRRNKILNAQSKLWQQSPPKENIIAAGITGTVPAVAQLLKTINKLPNAEIILPSYDENLDDESWKALRESHPQHAFKNLLEKLHSEREQIQIWPHCDKSLTSEQQKNKALLATEIMRPASTTHKWQELSNNAQSEKLIKLINGDTLHRVECDNPQNEALIISVLMREILENPNKTCALVTPDRHLARRVSSSLEKWNIKIDDSGGFNLAHSRTGSFILLSLEACIKQLSPIALMSLLSHNLTTAGGQYKNFRSNVRLLEKKVLRGPKPDKPDLDGILEVINEKRHDNYDPISQEEAGHLTTLIETLRPLLTPLIEAIGSKKPLKEWLEIHLTLLEQLCQREDELGSEILWSGDDGESAASFLSELYEQAMYLGNISAEEYYDILEHFMKAQMIRPNYGTHPRLIILGLMEARLYHADRFILAGLNEKTWPPETQADMWMSRPMRTEYGLPDPDRVIGQAAHDFIENFCGAEVFMTRAIKLDNSPTVPSRWWQRMDTIAASLGTSFTKEKSEIYKDWARTLSHSSAKPQPTERPAPCPPRHYRPKKLSVTAIEKWMMDPYTIYARHILKLKKLKPLEEDVDAAEKGSIMHHIFDQFVTAHPDSIPDNAEDIIVDMAQNALGERMNNAAMENFWWPRFVRLASWFVENEKDWRKSYRPAKTEVDGALDIEIEETRFTITARADRIDLKVDNRYAIIDYKTGSPPSKTDIISGSKPQLSLEAAILLKAGYEQTNAGSISYIGAWKLSGGYPQAEKKDLFLSDGREDPNQIAEDALQGLKTLVHTFDNDNTPYLSFPNLPDQIPPSCQDYVHLARVKEWAETSSGGDT